jgi:hypothetical protein
MMRTPVHTFVSLLAASAFAAIASPIALAQNATPPARETPNPDAIDPAVNTSDTAAAPAPAGETPRPQDIDPAVDTSSPSQTPGSSSAPAPAQPGAPPSSRSGATGAAAQAPAGAQGQAAKPAARRGMDRLELDTTQITGNRELPKVLYIVPWKRSDLGDLVGRPVNSLLDEVLTPVDRDVFKRENRYYRALAPGNDEGAGMPLGDKPPSYRPPSYGSVPAAGSAGSADRPPTGSGSSAPRTGNER